MERDPLWAPVSPPPRPPRPHLTGRERRLGKPSHPGVRAAEQQQPRAPLPKCQAPMGLSLPMDRLTCLPQVSYQRAPAVPHHPVQPLPGLVVDRLSHCNHTRQKC